MSARKISETTTRRKTTKSTTPKKTIKRRTPKASLEAEKIEAIAAAIEPETIEIPDTEQQEILSFAVDTFPELPITPDSTIDGITKGISSIISEPGTNGYGTSLIQETIEPRTIIANDGYDISKKVLARIASIAASEIDGMVPPRNDAFNKFIDSIHGRTDGIKVDFGTTEAAVDMLIRVQFGTHIPDITGRLRERIARRIHEMTGLSVARVNIRVQDVIPVEETRVELPSNEPPAAII
ncbi:MAG: Asp23/Gls24 family envelope stress response protein [bacterium]|nr:Asp23/Gls24 family envelope stress response protein [bacterium]